MAFTQSDIENLRAAVVSGILTVRYDGPPARQITYQGLGEMRSLLASMERDQARAAGRSTVRFASTRKGT